SAGRDAEAEPHLRESLRLRTELESEHWNVVKNGLFLAKTLLRQKKYAEAEPLLIEIHAKAGERTDQAPSWERGFPADIADGLIELYTALDKPDEVKKWQTERAKYDPALAPAKDKK